VKLAVEIVARRNINQWGGDLSSLFSLCDGLNSLGIGSRVVSQVDQISADSIVFLSNTCLDKRAEAGFLASKGRKYWLLPFHEDFLAYFDYSIGFAKGIAMALERKRVEDIEINFSLIRQTPHIVRYLGSGSSGPLAPLKNYHVLMGAEKIYPTSEKEKSTLLRDCPRAKVEVVMSPSGTVVDSIDNLDKDYSFRSTYGIDGQYVLQVGRLESRKNQLATLAALADIPITLVFIATQGYQPWYENLFLRAANVLRSYPTILISQNLDPSNDGMVSVKRMVGGEKLPVPILIDAYRNASLNCHPAFYELPGLTYFESLALGVPTICSEWASFREYVKLGENCNSKIKFVSPIDLAHIRRSSLDLLYPTSELLDPEVEKVDAIQYAKRILKSCLEGIE